MVGAEPHTLRHIEHKVTAQQRKTHIATEIAEQITDFIPNAERSVNCFCSHFSSLLHSQKIAFSKDDRIRARALCVRTRNASTYFLGILFSSSLT